MARPSRASGPKYWYIASRRWATASAGSRVTARWSSAVTYPQLPSRVACSAAVYAASASVLFEAGSGSSVTGTGAMGGAGSAAGPRGRRPLTAAPIPATHRGAKAAPCCEGEREQ